MNESDWQMHGHHRYLRSLNRVYIGLRELGAHTPLGMKSEVSPRQVCKILDDLISS